MLTAISDWRDKTGVSIQEDEFFLRKEAYDQLYRFAQDRYNLFKTRQPDKNIPEVIEQLSPKGLALLSYIYAKKDNNVAQPIIASTYTDFKNLIKLFVDASSGVQCTVILQITDIETLNSVVKSIGRGHKSVFKLEKIDDIIRIINIDSAGYDDCYSRIIDRIMRKISYQQPYEFLTNKHHKNLLTHKSFFRQNDYYQ